MVKAKTVPGMMSALSVLRPLFPILLDAFEKATQDAKDIFKNSSIDFALGLHADLTRSFLLKYLKSKNLGNFGNLKVKALNNNGIQINHTDWLIRARKSRNGAVPPPRTARMTNFYSQLTLGGGFDEINKVLLIWDTTKDGDLTRLWLVYPLSASIMKWRYDITASVAYKVAATSQVNVSSGKASSTATGDLPLVIQTQFTGEFTFDELGDLDLEIVGENGEFDYEEADEENPSEESREIG